jgi:TatA/E family protein of Tat protein translocase
MGPLGAQEIIVIFILALILFGPKKLPELGHMLGKAVSEFRKAKNELRSTWESHMAEIEREGSQIAPSTTPATDYSSAHYSYPYEDYDQYDAEQPSAAQTPPMHELEAAAVKSAPAEPAGGHETSAPHSLAVPGTVARSNGALPGSSGPISTKEEHPAA